MIDQTEEIDVQYLRGSALPRYVERLDDVEWVTDRSEPPTVARTLALCAIVIGMVMVLVGLVIARSDARPPADMFPTRIETPAASPHAQPASWERVPDRGSRPEVAR